MNKNEFEKLYQEFSKPLYNFCLRWVFDPSLAEEITQESFIKIWKRADKIEQSRSKSYLFKTAQNTCFDYLRKRKIFSALSEVGLVPKEEDEIPSNEDCLIKTQELIELKKSLEAIPMKYRQVLMLSYYGEMNYKEISSLLNISEGTVASRKSRGLDLLKDQWKEVAHVF